MMKTVAVWSKLILFIHLMFANATHDDIDDIDEILADLPDLSTLPDLLSLPDLSQPTNLTRSREEIPATELSKKLRHEVRYVSVTNRTELKPGQAAVINISIKETEELFSKEQGHRMWFQQFYVDGILPAKIKTEIANLCGALWTKKLKEGHKRTCKMRDYPKNLSPHYIQTKEYNRKRVYEKADIIYCYCHDNRGPFSKKRDGKHEKFYIYKHSDQEYILLEPTVERCVVNIKNMLRL